MSMLSMAARPAANSMQVDKKDVPRLDFKKDEDKSKDDASKKPKHKRQLSDSSRGSIGRRERLRNALTGRSDGSGDGADQPLELPDEEFCDFMASYDKSDPYCRKVTKREVDADYGDGINDA